MIYTHCLDAYASHLWDYGDKRIEKYYVAWRKLMRKVCKLDTILENSLQKFICSIINRENMIVNNVFRFALNNNRYVLGKTIDI